MKVGTVKIHNRRFAIELLPNGLFRTDLDGDTIESSTKATLIQRLRMMTRDAVRVKIAATLVEHDELKAIVLIGFHSSNGNLLYTVPSKKGVQQMYKYSSTEKVLCVLDDKGRAEYKALVKAQQTAEKAVNQWLKAHRLDPQEMVRKALAKAAPPAAGEP